MRTYHLLYTLDGEFHNEMRLSFSFQDVEFWLTSIGATYWEIGIEDSA